jgi:hypothetical protein
MSNETPARDSVLLAKTREEALLAATPVSEFGIDVRTFVWLADRWAALGERQRVAALAMIRGSMDSAAEMVGPQFHGSGPEDFKINEVWDEVADLVFDLNWHCEPDDESGETDDPRENGWIGSDGRP